MIFSNFNIKERIFLLYMLFFSTITALAVVINISIGLDFYFNYKWLAVSISTTTFAYLAYKRFHIKILHRIAIYFLCIILLPICWIYSSGLLSPATFYTPLLFLLANFLTKGKERIAINILLTLLIMVLIWLYYNMNHLFKPVTPSLQYIDWMAHTPLILAFLSALLITFEKAYEEERKNNIEREKQLEVLATTDNLTGLLNRNQMDHKLELYHNIFQRGAGNYSLILVDIDNFKLYNDLYGHIAGDRCLEEFANILKKQLKRGTDWVFRYGGEEFLILLGFTHEVGAKEVAENILKDICNAQIEHKGSSTNSKLTASLGISTSRDGDFKPSDIIHRADEALYFSKNSGKNKVSIG